MHSVDKTSFSIITVVKDDKAGLLSTEKSLKQQTYQNYEWLVIDGDSSDGTKEYLSSDASIASKFISEKDSGIYDAMNKGLRLSEGDYVVFLNAGDVLPADDTLESIISHVGEEKAPVDAIFGGASLCFSNGSTWYRAPRKMENAIWHGLPANHQATYVRRELLSDFAYPDDYVISGDYYLAAIVYQKTQHALYIDEPLVKFRIGDTSYRSPKRAINEAYRIQRDVLHKPFVTRLLSMLRRIIAITGTIIIENKSRLRAR